MPIDTTMYPTSQSKDSSSNPLSEIENMIQTKYMMNRIQRGSPQTEGSLGLLGAGSNLGSSWNDGTTMNTNNEEQE